MDIADYKKQCATNLPDKETANMDTDILLSYVLGRDISWVLAHPEYKLNDKQEKTLNSLIARRRRHEPIAYILGKSEFYGREFYVDKNVLVPRPESETIIDLLKQVAGDRKTEVDKQIIIDVGTGSGALAITAKLELPNAKVMAIDIDAKCLSVTRKNAKEHKVDVEFFKGDLLAPLKSQISNLKSVSILANLPYVPADYPTNQAARHEPAIALFAGADGLDLYRKLFSQISNLKSQISLILTESLVFQHEELARIAKSAGYKLINEQDLIQVFELT